MTHILPDNYKSDFQLTRKSQDKIINPQGRDLLDLCVSAQLRILNGRFIGDLLGNMTFFSMKGCSVVDYAITSESLLSSVNYFIVKTPSYFSDHNQIVCFHQKSRFMHKAFPVNRRVVLSKTIRLGCTGSKFL